MLLITAFEPFDGSGLNASALALQLFLERHPHEINGVPLTTAILPVSYNDDVLALERACEKLPEPPHVVVHLGQTFRGEIAIETRAVNVKKVGGEHEPIDADAPEFLDSTFDASAIVQALQHADLPAGASQDAGTFLCNHILFRSLQKAQRENASRAIGFVHLPRLREQLQPHELEASAPLHLPLQVLARAIELSAEVVAASLRNAKRALSTST